jgi:integrase
MAAEQQATALTDSFVQSWLTKAYGRLSPTTQHGAARAVVRMVNWAVAEGLLERSPLKHFRKPTPNRRERMITPEEYAACLRAASDTHIKSSVRPMKDAIRFLFHTGCRPQELRVIEAKHIADFKVVLPKELSKGKRKARVIIMDTTAKAIALRLAKHYPTGPLFRNADRNPWTKDSLGMAMRRLGKRAGVNGLCAYAFRHGNITRLVEKGIDLPTVAAISGNSVRMVSDVYSHCEKNELRLLGIVSGS